MKLISQQQLEELVYTSIDHTGVFSDTKGIADATGLKHSYIMQKCKRLMNIQEIGGNNIMPSSYLSNQNKKLPMYQLDRAGSLALLLSFKGKKYDWLRLHVANRFIDQEKELVSWRGTREETKKLHHSFTDSIKIVDQMIRDERAAHGKQYHPYYPTIQRQINSCITGEPTPQGIKQQDFRDTLPREDLERLNILEENISTTISRMLDNKLKGEEIQTHLEILLKVRRLSEDATDRQLNGWKKKLTLF